MEKTKTGRLTAKVRVYGTVVIDGEQYTYDLDTVRAVLKKVKE